MAQVTAPGYPDRWEADVVLRDGGVAHVRPIRPEDGPAVERFHAGQSPESIYLRFFAPIPRLSQSDVHRFTHVDHTDRVALVATVGDDIIGIARYDRLGHGVEPDATVAEVAFNISDAHQGRGIGSVLLEHLATAARERGIARFVAEVLPQNRKMMSVFAEAGYEVRHRFDDGVIALSFDISPTEASAAVRESREHRAEARSVAALLHPRSVVVVGASREPASIGHKLLENIVASGFTGAVHAVNPEAFEVLGVPALASVAELPGEVDLAVIAVPAEAVNDVVADCARAGVHGLVVVSSGFAETGEEGLARQRELVRLARSHGMRVVGPNSFGLVCTDPDVAINASLAPTMPPQGRLGLFSQSGALGIAVLDSAARRGLGVSSFVSAGNRADVSGNDLMQYWVEDPRTDAVGLYLESIGNPRKFSRVARRLARTKPVVVVKSGISSYGVPPGHHVRPSRLPREALDAMFKQSGVIRVENVHQLFDVAQLVVNQPLPAGRRVAVVGNSDSLGALAADAAVSWGLEIVHGPRSVRSEATAEEFTQALQAAFADEDVDSVIACFIPPLATDQTEVAQSLAALAATSSRTCIATFLGVRTLTDALTTTAPDGTTRVVPAFATPEDGVRALAAATRYAEWRRRDPGHRVDPPATDPAAARAVVQRVLAEHPEGAELGASDARELLAAYGVRLWEAAVVRDADAAAEAAATLGYPVALKTTAPHLRHRVDLGAVRLGISGEPELRAAYADLVEVLRPSGGHDRLVVQAMADPGVACVVRTVEDELFGPVVSFGVGGPPTELLGDVSHRIPPLTDVDVADLVTSLRAAPLLFGHRGAAPVDVPAVEDVLARVSRLADDLPEVESLELNPVVVAEQGAAVLDAAIRVAPAPGRTDSGRRALT